MSKVWVRIVLGIASLLAEVRRAIDDQERRRGVEVMAKTSAEELIELGEARGERRSEARARRETLLRLMRPKFGALPADVEIPVAAIEDTARLDELLARVLTATSVAEMGV